MVDIRLTAAQARRIAIAEGTTLAMVRALPEGELLTTGAKLRYSKRGPWRGYWLAGYAGDGEDVYRFVPEARKQMTQPLPLGF